MGQTEPALATLSAQARGCLLGASLLGLGEAAMGRLAVHDDETWPEVWQMLRALPRPERATVLAGWLAEMKTPFPDGMERLHPSWIARAITREPEDLWPVLLSGVPGAAAVAALLPARGDASEKTSRTWPVESVCELQRCVFLPLAELVVPPAGPIGAGLCRLSCAELLVEVARRGSGLAARSGADSLPARGLAALYRELHREGNASVRAVAGRLPAELGHAWLDG